MGRRVWGMLGGMVAVALTTPLVAQTRALDGAWTGDLPTGAGPLTIVVTFAGGDRASLAVPSRGLSGIPVTDLALGPSDSLSFAVPADGARFRGQRATPERIDGTWLQAGQRVDLTLRRSAEDAPSVPVRRQTPQAPFPYRVDEVRVEAGVVLACTATRPPEAVEPVPGAILLTVAGANDRDQTHAGHRPYAVLADHLARAGVATLRCDDRGVGGSEGDVLETDLEALTEDALAMIDRLARLDGVGPVGVIGSSEGSVVGSLAAAQAPDQVAFVVLLGGVGVSGADLIRERIVASARAEGATGIERAGVVARFDTLVALVREGGGVGLDSLAEARPDLHERFVELARTAGADDPFLPRDPMDRARLLAGPWYFAQLTLDGGAVLERVESPVLALTGSKDRTNLPGQNLPAIRRALARGGNLDATVEEIPDLNHVFQTARVGGPREYARLEESFAPVALERISTWILARFGG